MTNDPRDHFEKCVRLVELYTGKPWDGTVEPLHDALAVQEALTDALEAHTDWLSRLKAEAERRGMAWNTAAVCLISAEDDDTAPPYRPTRDW